MAKDTRYPWLDHDAPLVPVGLAPRPDVEYGCGSKDCADCYTAACPHCQQPSFREPGQRCASCEDVV
mgnify:CR=1 FL=1